MKDDIQAIDTNVIVRYITRDNEALYKRAVRLLSSAFLYFEVDDIAISETIYVLERTHYALSRQEIVRYLLDFLEIPSVVCRNRDVVRDAFSLYLAHPALSFNDCYLAVKTALLFEEPLWTFDKKLAKQSGMAKLVSAA